MKTYFYTETESDKRGYNVCITVYRVLRNRPVFIGSTDHQTAGWYGARYQAQLIIHEIDHINMEGNKLKGLLNFAKMYDTTSGNGIRLFEV
jgi:hypothetical protein